MKGGRYYVVTSPKPQRAGEAFIMRAGKFYAKVYKEVPDAKMFAEHLCRLLNAELEGEPT